MKGLASTGAIACIVGLLSLLAGPARGAWEELERRDVYRIVVVDHADVYNVPVYWEALRQVCKKEFCNIAFFSRTTSLPPPKKRLSDEDLAHALLVYTTNKGFAWSCKVHRYADNCFSW